MKTNAVVLFSGGQDSTTCLYWAISNFEEVKALTIDYGQRHKIEIDSARKIAEKAQIDHTIIKIDFLKNIGDSALFGEGEVSSLHRTGSLPASFVPGRNIFFLTICAAYAYKYGIKNIVTGVCQTDFSGYPDCRDDTIKSLQVTLNLGMDYNFTIYTPLMYMTKAESIKLAQKLPGCIKALGYSHTCYNGKFPPCGKCPACKLRSKGFKEAGIIDPLLNIRGGVNE